MLPASLAPRSCAAPPSTVKRHRSPRRGDGQGVPGGVVEANGQVAVSPREFLPVPAAVGGQDAGCRVDERLQVATGSTAPTAARISGTTSWSRAPSRGRRRRRSRWRAAVRAVVALPARPERVCSSRSPSRRHPSRCGSGGPSGSGVCGGSRRSPRRRRRHPPSPVPGERDRRGRRRRRGDGHRSGPRPPARAA